MPQRTRPILTVTLNAAVDKTYLVPGFALDRVHRPALARTTAGGKGVNVARVYGILGGRSIATGFLGGGNGNTIARLLLDEGIDARFVCVADESRLCLAIMDPKTGTQTEVNEIGPRVTPAECDALRARLAELLPGCAAVVLSGSAPPGVPATFYRDVIRLAQEEFGVLAVLDASGEALVRGVEAQPFLVKPNQFEMTALGVTVDGWAEAAQVLRRQYGLSNVMVTAQERGAVLATADGIWEASPPSVRVFSAVGSGDALTAGFLWAWGRGESLPEALRLGVGAGTANVMSYSAGFLDSTQVFNLASRTRLTRLAG